MPSAICSSWYGVQYLKTHLKLQKFKELQFPCGGFAETSETE
jgi:hypothetical protein